LLELAAAVLADVAVPLAPLAVDDELELLPQAATAIAATTTLTHRLARDLEFRRPRLIFLLSN